MHRASFGHRRVPPRDRPVEGEVDLEGAGAVSVFPEGLRVSRPHPRAGDRQQLAWRHVKQGHAVVGQVRERVDTPVGDDLAPERGQLGRQRLGNPRRAALGYRPAHGVRAGQEEHREGAAQRLVEPEHRMRGAACQERAGLWLVEGADQPRGGLQRANPEPSEAKGTIRLERDVEWRQHVLDERVPVGEVGTDEPAVCRPIRSQ